MSMAKEAFPGIMLVFLPPEINRVTLEECGILGKIQGMNRINNKGANFNGILG